jgi:hypothetical protein
LRRPRAKVLPERLFPVLLLSKQKAPFKYPLVQNGRLDSNHQLGSLSYDIELLSLHPSTTLLKKLQIKIPNHSSKNDL